MNAPALLDDTLAWMRSHAAPGTHLHADSRRVSAGDVFAALPGRQHTGAAFLRDAQRRGAAAALVDGEEGLAGLDLPQRAVPGLAAQLGPLAAGWYGEPTRALRVIGVTGTNGKTSTCRWIAELLDACGQPCASLGTLGYQGPHGHAGAQTGLTTPDAASVQRLAASARDAGAQALAMEASSIGIEQGRLDGVHLDVAVFTNLSRDHLDYHGNMDRYAAQKARLFAWPGLRAAVINLDDPLGPELAQAASARGIAVTGTTLAPGRAMPAGVRRLAAMRLAHDAAGLQLTVQGETAAPPLELRAPLVGDFNAANLLGAVAVALACGAAPAAVAAACSGLRAPPGRLQALDGPSGHQGPLVLVDYAHTPDAIAKVLAALRPLAQARGGRLWIVFGAGGNRDPGKRAAMGAAASAADHVLVTSDNPRSEDPLSIVRQVAAGVLPQAALQTEVDRLRAVQAAIAAAGVADVVLLAGKGHEDYQEVAGRRLPYSDVQAGQRALAARAEARA